LSAPPIQTPRDAWSRWIGTAALLSQVWNTAPFPVSHLPAAEPGRLIDPGYSPHGFLRIPTSWRSILRPNLTAQEQLQDHFAAFLACHHPTVATFVPADVDTKIGIIVWRDLLAGRFDVVARVLMRAPSSVPPPLAKLLRLTGSAQVVRR
jgi:hypothetical protein